EDGKHGGTSAPVQPQAAQEQLVRAQPARAAEPPRGLPGREEEAVVSRVPQAELLLEAGQPAAARVERDERPGGERAYVRGPLLSGTVCGARRGADGRGESAREA